MALTMLVGGCHAQQAPAFGLTPEQAGRMGDIAERSLAEGKLWAGVKAPLQALYRELRKRGETRSEATHNLRRIGLPGVEVSEFGERGALIRRDLERLARYVGQKDGLNEAAATSVVFLAFHETLAALAAADGPTQIHMAIAGDDGVEARRRSEDLYQAQVPRLMVKFSEKVDDRTGQVCEVDTLRLNDVVYFTLTCRAGGPGSFPLAASTSECGIHDDRMKPARLVLQSAASAPSREVLVWCSGGPR